MKGQVPGHLKGLDRDKAPAAGIDRPVESSDPQVRTCPSCGQRAPVRLDPEGSWAWCSACGRAA